MPDDQATVEPDDGYGSWTNVFSELAALIDVACDVVYAVQAALRRSVNGPPA